METPMPIMPIDFYENRNKNIKNIIKKEYKIEINDNKYNLIITLDNEFIELKVYHFDDLAIKLYKNKFNLDSINNILNLNINKYYNLEKVLELIDTVYTNKIFCKLIII